MYLGYNTNGLPTQPARRRSSCSRGSATAASRSRSTTDCLNPYGADFGRELNDAAALLQRHNMRSVIETAPGILLDPQRKARAHARVGRRVRPAAARRFPPPRDRRGRGARQRLRVAVVGRRAALGRPRCGHGPPDDRACGKCSSTPSGETSLSASSPSRGCSSTRWRHSTSCVGLVDSPRAQAHARRGPPALPGRNADRRRDPSSGRTRGQRAHRGHARRRARAPHVRRRRNGLPADHRRPGPGRATMAACTSSSAATATTARTRPARRSSFWTRSIRISML